MSLSWSDWYNISETKDVPNSSGVYRVRLARDDEPVTIPRFLGADPDGILWIGKSKNLRDRLRAARRALCGKDEQHSEAELLHALQQITDLKTRYPQPEYKYQYSFACLGSEGDAEGCEKQLILDYIKRYGELPPLNRAIPGKQLLDKPNCPALAS